MNEKQMEFAAPLYAAVVWNSIWVISYLYNNIYYSPSEEWDWAYLGYSVVISLTATINGVYIALIVMLHKDLFSISLAKNAMYVDCFLQWYLSCELLFYLYDRFLNATVRCGPTIYTLLFLLLNLISWFPFFVKYVIAQVFRSFEKDSKQTFKRMLHDEAPV